MPSVEVRSERSTQALLTCGKCYLPYMSVKIVYVGILSLSSSQRSNVQPYLSDGCSFRAGKPVSCMEWTLSK